MNQLAVSSIKQSGFRPIDKQAVSLSIGFMSRLGQIESHVVLSDGISASSTNFKCTNERSPLKAVAVSLPTYLDWANPINEVEAANMNNRPDRTRAVIEHFGFIMGILSKGVKVHLIGPHSDLPESVYTRDIAFVVGNKLIRCNMGADVRKNETRQILGAITPPSEVILEGGNVILEGDKLFLGIGDRTNVAAAKWLQEIVGGDFEVIQIPLNPGVLHLDCAFGPIALPNGHSGGALVYPSAFTTRESLDLLKQVYGKLYPVSEHDYHHLGTNGFWINPDTVFANPDCPKIVKLLKSLGKEVLTLPMDEVVKGEGYARCSTLPLLRE